MRPGTLRVLEPEGGLIVSPVEGMVVWFGRNRPDVHICIGPDDLGVSRRHGTLEYRSGCWWVRATGGRPVRLGRSQELWSGDEPVPLADGRTSLQVEGTNPNEVHVLRVEVAAGSPALTPLRSERCSGRTDKVRGHWLKPDERLVLTVVAQRVLRRYPNATLLTCREAVAELEVLQSGVWTPKKVEHRVSDVRERLAAHGVKRLKREPDDTRHDDSYRRNLVDELIRSGTLTPADLRLLDRDDEEHEGVG
jgi:hypothetical protein